MTVVDEALTQLGSSDSLTTILIPDMVATNDLLSTSIFGAAKKKSRS